MNTHFSRDLTSIIRVPYIDLPRALTDRFQNIFRTVMDNQEHSTNYQSLIVLGELAVVTGTVGLIASAYFQSSQYVPECIGNILLGGAAIMHGSISHSHQGLS